MNTTSIKTNQTPIILSRGIFDLLKDYIRRRKLSRFNELKLELELKSARQVLRREIPPTIVDINKQVTVKALDSGEEYTYNLVAHERARAKNNTLSVLSPIGIAMLGYEQGSELTWEMPEGIRSFRILKVSDLEA
jgi:regulator of nucleoside diphosphate kinase